ncbi:N-acetylglucosamine kinase [Streptosporangium carneum]|uniref:N-acetylglucosamine kinase n=1 Tax=Streptosporangium carneum TaxID=47481 RepID=A0A9W6MDD6_9ACTN|nr:BadF/BadG/BcrA/BcrD ATPase family protein [Streptosporangium carneum]GLK09820.1 N-acetylglucosamine kinase [Streptosporangium carneum]
MRTVLAVDGGNSKTDVALVAEDGSVLATARGAAFQPQSAGVGVAIDAVGDAVRAMLGQDAALPFADHVAAYVAGADLPVEEDALRDEIVARGYGGNVVVGNDTFALLRAGASGPAGVAVVCGAGINAVAVSPTGEVTRYPALGRLTGDWGGGYGLGEETLWSAIRSEDGRGPATALERAVREHFGASTVERVSLDIHFGDLPPGRLHELVPVLMAVAASGDAVARSIVTRMADEVTVLGVVALRRLDLLDTPMEVVLGGGVLTARDPLLNGLIEERFAEQAPRAKLVVADVPPIVGAALLGLDALDAAEEAKARLRAHFHAAA